MLFKCVRDVFKVGNGQPSDLDVLDVTSPRDRAAGIYLLFYSCEQRWRRFALEFLLTADVGS